MISLIDQSVIKILIDAKSKKECELYKLSIEFRSLESKYVQLEKEMKDIEYALNKIKEINKEINKEYMDFLI